MHQGCVCVCVISDNDGHVLNMFPKTVPPSSFFSAHQKSLFVFLVKKVNSLGFLFCYFLPFVMETENFGLTCLVKSLSLRQRVGKAHPSLRNACPGRAGCTPAGMGAFFHEPVWRASAEGSAFVALKAPPPPQMKTSRPLVGKNTAVRKPWAAY